MSKHYLITGGAGFIGSHLADALRTTGHTLTILDDLSTGKRTHIAKDVEFIHGDVSDAGLVAQAMQNADGVFHLAAIASVARANAEWVRAHHVNVGGTVAVFAEAAKRRIPVVYASSAAIYGNTAPPLHEHTPAAPINAYGVDKYASELHGNIASSIHKTPTIGLRFFNIYGHRQDASSPYAGVISIFADLLMKNAPLTVYGGGQQTRDFIYVGDAVQALIRAMDALESKKLHHGVFNICTGHQTSILILAETLAKILSVPYSLNHAPAREGDIHISVGDPVLAQSILGFTAESTLEQGLRTWLKG